MYMRKKAPFIIAQHVERPNNSFFEKKNLIPLADRRGLDLHCRIQMMLYTLGQSAKGTKGDVNKKKWQSKRCTESPRGDIEILSLKFSRSRAPKICYVKKTFWPRLAWKKVPCMYEAGLRSKEIEIRQIFFLDETNVRRHTPSTRYVVQVLHNARECTYIVDYFQFFFLLKKEWETRVESEIKKEKRKFFIVLCIDIANQAMQMKLIDFDRISCTNKQFLFLEKFSRGLILKNQRNFIQHS